MAKYRKKPVVVEAIQWHSPYSNHPGVKEDSVGSYVETAHGQRAYLQRGDWIIEEPDGRGYYPCKPDIFAASYEPVNAEAT